MNNLTKLVWPAVVIVVLVLFHKQIGAQFDRLTGVSIQGCFILNRFNRA